mgnify:CR=1 FL=1
MGQSAIIDEIEAGHLKKDIPEFNVGDNLKVSFKIIRSFRVSLIFFIQVID